MHSKDNCFHGMQMDASQNQILCMIDGLFSSQYDHKFASQAAYHIGHGSHAVEQQTSKSHLMQSSWHVVTTMLSYVKQHKVGGQQHMHPVGVLYRIPLSMCIITKLCFASSPR